MIRKASVIVSLVVLVACGDGNLINTPSESPNLAVSDAAHQDGDDNEHFYFLPPLVPTPSYDGEFLAGLSPTVSISQLPAGPDDSSPDCIIGAPIRVFSGADVTSDPDAEVYAVNWQTGEDDLTAGAGYRICVEALGVFLGFRDVQPDESGADVPRNTEQTPIYQFNNRSNLPIKFRIERQALCSREGVFDCTEALLDAEGGEALCVDETCTLIVEPNALKLNEEFLFIVERVECTMVNGRIRHVNVDLPQFGGCLNISVPGDQGFTGFQIGAIAGACVDAPDLSEDQRDLLQLHHEKQSGGVEALPNVPANSLDCTEFAIAAMERDMNGVERLAHRLWRGVRRNFSPLWAPEPAYAVDRGFGGGEVMEESPFAWALPAQMEQVGWTNQETGQVGSPVSPQPAVFVFDDSRNAVAGATVTFEVTQGNGPPTTPIARVTGSDGKVTLPWTLDPVGLNVMEARGIGIGVSANGDGYHIGPVPPGGSGPYADHHDEPEEDNSVDLGTGVLSFEAVACDNTTLPALDGVVSAGEYGSYANFTAKLSGGATPATIRWTTDCENLYIAVTVATASESDNASLRVVFDNDADETQELNDDILFLERLKSGRTINWVFSDRHVSADCLGNNAKADCGAVDASSDGAGLFTPPTAGTSTFEFVHPLSSGDVNDFDLNVGESVGFYVVLQLGNGPQGNTVWPGLREYCEFLVGANVGDVTASCPAP